MDSPMPNNFFTFKRFTVFQDLCAMKVGTDGTMLGAWAAGGKRILDIGTGTGLIALMMAQRFPEAHVTAIDIDKGACKQAEKNISASPFASQLTVQLSSVQDFAEQYNGIPFDSIVCNPPFFVNSMECPDKQRSLARHASCLRFEELFSCVSSLISENGIFSAIIPFECLSAFNEAAYTAGMRCICQCAVKTVPRKAPKRFLLAYSSSHDLAFTSTVECLDDGTGNRSEWYSNLTSEFYL